MFLNMISMANILINAQVVLPVPERPMTIKLELSPTTSSSSSDSLNLITYKLGILLMNETKAFPFLKSKDDEL